jgi:hypothetical protein
METETETKTGGAAPAGDHPGGHPSGAVTESPVESDVGTHAARLAVDYEGLRGGRKRLDGLIPGSDAAKKASALYESIRKWQDRNPGLVHPQERSLHPEIAKRISARRKPLPAGTVPVAEAIRHIPVEPLAPPLPAAAPVVDSATISASPTPDNLVAAAELALVRWAGTDFEPLIEEALGVCHDWRNFSREKQLRLAHLPEKSILEIEEETKWNERWTKIIRESGSRVFSKLLNKAGISAEYKDEIFLGLAVLAIAGSELRWARRIPKLIQAANAGAVANKP